MIYRRHKFALPQRGAARVVSLYILQRGVQWKQGVVICMVLYTILLYNTTPIHCTPLRLHPPVMNTQSCHAGEASFGSSRMRCLRMWGLKLIVY